MSGQQKKPRPFPYRHLVDRLDSIDARLRRLIVQPRIKETTRTELRNILEEETMPVLAREGRR